MRRQFDLPANDVEYLDGTRLKWEAVKEGAKQWLLIHDRPTHVAFTPTAALTALLIVPGYPDSQLDMVWFSPALTPNCAKSIKQLSSQAIDGRPFQRWSRHRTPQNPWRPGLDDVASHLITVDHWLAREVA